MSSLLRIALIAPFGLGVKGTTRARVVPLGKALSQQGHRVSVFIPPYDSLEDSGRCWRDEDIDVINMTLPTHSGVTPGPGHLALGMGLARAVRAWEPDVIHVFKPKGPSGLAGWLVWMQRAPSALIVDADDWEGSGGWNDDPRSGYSVVARGFFTWQEKFGLSHADAWTVTSACLRQRAVDFGADDARIRHLPNGVSDATLRTAPARDPEPDTLLLYSRFAGVRVSEVMAVWAQLRALRPETKLIVIGRGLAGEEDALAEVPGITRVGWVPPAELPGWLGRTAVAVLPWADTPTNRARHSAKLLELMAAGLPIVAYAIGEIPVTLGDAGVLVAAGDTAAFASATAALLSDPARGRTLGDAARARVASMFTWEQLAAQALDSYRIALSHRSLRR